MDLNQTDLGYFISQIAASTLHWGFSQQDSEELATQLNAKYNVRCSPAVGTQLYSLCQDPSCPLAGSPDCDAYLNLGPSGVISSATATATTQFTPSAVSSTTATSSSAPASTTNPAPTQSPSSASSISSGAIAGIAIGGAALTFAFVLALVFLLRFNKKNRNGQSSESQSNTGIPSFATSPRTDPHSSYVSNQRVQEWNGPPIAEMESVGSPGPGPGPGPERGMSTSPLGRFE
jgi:hypothetical protein